jgi:hypothetical protein
MYLHTCALIQTIFLHIHYLSGISIYAPRMLSIRVLGLNIMKYAASIEVSTPTLSSVSTLIAFPPLFCTRVLGTTSIASATALNGHPSTPVTLRAFACKPTLIAISVAPPPGASWGLKYALRATLSASARFRSISLRMSLDGPRRSMVHALGFLHSVRNVKYLRGTHKRGSKTEMD